jgi:hypothetical protein
MPVDGPDPKGPVVLEPLVAPQLMVNPGQHLSELIGRHQPQDIPHTVCTGLDPPNQSFDPPGLT